MKYLVIGDANSMHIYNFTKNFLIPKGYEIHLLTLATQPVREGYRKFYKENKIILHSVAEKNYKGLDKTDRLHRMINLIRKLKLMKDVPKVDICHLQSVYKTSVMMILHNKRKYKKFVLSYWGGDLEVCSKKILKFIEKALNRADAITVTVKKVLDDFHSIYGNKYDDKVSICRFATAGIEYINKISKTLTREECRQSYSIPHNKICITCGYSAYREQHQELCLKKIGELPKRIKDNIYCIVPMQYGRMNDTDYINAVKQEQERADFDCIILKDFVPFEMSAKLAIATDIYLHLRDTDAFSNALKEHVYGGSLIIKGDWLEYKELEEMSAHITSIKNFNELTDTLHKIIDKYHIPKKIELFDPIYELYSTENINAQWAKVIDKL